MLGTLEEPATLIAWLYFYITIAGVILIVGFIIFYLVMLYVAYRDEQKSRRVREIIERFERQRR
jgi:heme/copper-type cytochrome/quinol oxidase subunit 2